MPTATLEVAERSSIFIDREQYRRLEDSADFMVLCDQGILSLARTGGSFRLNAGPHVGHALIGDMAIHVREKVPGALASMLAATDATAIRETSLSSTASDSAGVVLTVLDRFIDAVDKYLAMGRVKHYQEVRAVGCVPRGKIDVAATMRRWVLGRPEVIAYRQWHLSPRLLLNRAVGLALHAAEHFVPANDDYRRRRLRTLGILFDDVQWQQLGRCPRPAIRAAFDELFRIYPDMQGLVSLSRFFALHCGTTCVTHEDELPYSWFVNLETLFEECVRSALQEASAGTPLVVSDWRQEERFLFASGNTYRTEPDIVVWHRGKPFAILDAKYKSLPDAGPDHGDLYQLIAHARAWSVREAFLVYPGNRTDCLPLGEDALGTRVGSFVLDVTCVRRAAADLVDAIIARIQQAADSK
jgi:5-methylcytosine-specific restriction endonuclease McrBC regulatory subunit McrC